MSQPSVEDTVLTRKSKNAESEQNGRHPLRSSSQTRMEGGRHMGLQSCAHEPEIPRLEGEGGRGGTSRREIKLGIERAIALADRLATGHLAQTSSCKVLGAGTRWQSFRRRVDKNLGVQEL